MMSDETVIWRPDFSFWPGWRRSISPAMIATVAEGAPHQRGLVEPGLEVVAQHVLVEQLVERQPAGADQRREIAEAPDGDGVVRGDEAERAGAGALEPAGQQHAERLVREPALEGVADHEVLRAARKGFDEEAVARRQDRLLAAAARSQSLTWSGSRFQSLGFDEDAAHAVGEVGRERELAAHVGRDFRVCVEVRARDIGLGLEHALVGDDLGAEEEGVALGAGW